jgi:hypothetical protein
VVDNRALITDFPFCGFPEMNGPESEPEDKKAKDSPAAIVEPANEESASGSADLEALSQAEPGSQADISDTLKTESKEPGVLWEAASDEKPGNDGTPGAEPAVSDSDMQGDETVSSEGAAENENASSLTLTQHHVSHLLSDVLSETEEKPAAIKGLHFPMIFDCLLGLGLLVAVGGFTIGLFHMYLIHSASQCISEQRYKAAISLLKGAPMPQIYARTGSDTEELLSKARYLDAMDKLESGNNVQEAIRELNEIHIGSRYFALAQQAINENTEPAPVMLQGGAETTETGPVEEPKKTLLEKTLQEGEEQK